MALCWELIRDGTVRRIGDRGDLVLAGSAWWSVPPWRPHWLFDRWANANARKAIEAPLAFARLTGSPIVHASHAGELDCALPWAPFVRYRGRYEGATVIADSRGRVVASRPPTSGAGVVVADVDLTRGSPMALRPIASGSSIAAPSPHSLVVPTHPWSTLLPSQRRRPIQGTGTVLTSLQAFGREQGAIRQATHEWLRDRCGRHQHLGGGGERGPRR